MDQIFLETCGGTDKALEGGRVESEMGGEEMRGSSGESTEEEEEEAEAEEDVAWDQKGSELGFRSHTRDAAERSAEANVESDPRPGRRAMTLPAGPRGETQTQTLGEEQPEQKLRGGGGQAEEEEEEGERTGTKVRAGARKGEATERALEVCLRPIEDCKGYVRISLEEVERYYRFTRCCHWLNSKLSCIQLT